MTTVDEPIEFEVRDEDNEKGTRLDGRGCPVARGLRRAFPKGDVIVGTKFARIAGSTWLLPADLSEAIRAYDKDRTPIPPGRYALVERPYTR